MVDITESNKKFIKLIPNDKEEGIMVDYNVASMSKLIKTIVNNEGSDDDEDDKSFDDIPLANVSEKILKLILIFCEYHYENKMEEIEKPLKPNFKECVSEWDYNFISLTNFEELNYKDKMDMVAEIILAANYLDIKDLIELGCSKVASEIKGLTSEQIKEKFGFDDDVFTEDEKNQLNLNAKYSPKNKDDNNDDKDLNV